MGGFAARFLLAGARRVPDSIVPSASPSDYDNLGALISSFRSSSWGVVCPMFCLIGIGAYRTEGLCRSLLRVWIFHCCGIPLVHSGWKYTPRCEEYGLGTSFKGLVSPTFRWITHAATLLLWQCGFRKVSDFGVSDACLLPPSHHEVGQEVSTVHLRRESVGPCLSALPWHLWFFTTINKSLEK